MGRENNKSFDRSYRDIRFFNSLSDAVIKAGVGIVKSTSKK